MNKIIDNNNIKILKLMDLRDKIQTPILKIQSIQEAYLYHLDGVRLLRHIMSRIIVLCEKNIEAIFDLKGDKDMTDEYYIYFNNRMCSLYSNCNKIIGFCDRTINYKHKDNDDDTSEEYM